MSDMATGACQVPVLVGRLGSQETVCGGSSVSGSELTELFLMGQFLGPFCFQQLLMLESKLGVLRLEQLLLLQLDHAIGLIKLVLASQLGGSNALFFLVQGGCGDLLCTAQGAGS